MPAPAPPLAGGAAAGPAASEGCRQSPARPGATCAPSARHIFAASPEEPRGCGGAWSRSNNFFAAAFVRPAGLLSTAPEVGPHPAPPPPPLLPAVGAQGAGSGTQVAVPQHFPRPPGTRPGVRCRPGAAVRTATRHGQRGTTAAAAALTRRTDRAGPQWIPLPRKLHSLGRSVYPRLLPLAQQESQA
jgi:hypothetical protein